jgi:hypothetical protein
MLSSGKTRLNSWPGPGPTYLANRTLAYTDTISITLQVGRPFGNAMKPRIQCVRTHWMSGFIGVRGADVRLIGEAG